MLLNFETIDSFFDVRNSRIVTGTWKYYDKQIWCSDKNAKVLKELPRIDNVIFMYVIGPNK